MRIYGDYHVHTKYSHGKNTVLEMAVKAKELGLSEIAIADHGYGHWLYGMRRRDFDKMKADAAAASKQTGVNVLVGVESNIASCDGDLDLSKDEQGKFDIVLCGVHRAIRKGTGKRLHFKRWKNRIKENTEIVLKTLKNNKIDILTHPGRYLPIDIIAVAKTCKETGTLFELNSSSCDFKHEEFIKLAETGANFIVNSDAHHKNRVADVKGLLMRAGDIFADGQIVNTKKDFRWKR